MIEEKEDSKSKTGRHVWLGRYAISRIDEFAKKRGLEFKDAINEMLMLNGATSEDTGSSNQVNRSDIDALNRRIDVQQAVLETALLELIETSAHIRKVSQNVDGVDEFGKKEREKYELFFKQIRNT